MDYLSINRHLWNNKVAVHAKSDFYGLDAFYQHRDSLDAIVKSQIGDISGKSVLHLQCHFGMDTLSLAQRGAEVTGLDFSDVAIEKARSLSKELNLQAEFVCCDVYEAKKYIDKKFDIIFTSFGVLGWLPDLDRWAEVISHFLKPGGILYLTEFHPIIWIFDNEFTHIQYSWFNREPIIEQSTGTYSDRSAPIGGTEIGWNHSMEELFSSLLKHNMSITRFREFDYSPYPCFQNIVKISQDMWQIKGQEGKIPIVYSLNAMKNN